MGSGNGEYKAYKITTNWQESSANWTSPWTKEGGDYATPAIDAYKHNSGITEWHTFTVTSTITEFLSNPNENYGLLVITQSKNAGQNNYASSESTNKTERPKLKITYDSSTEIEPNKKNIIHNGMCHVTITNMQGRVVKTYKTNEPKKLHVENISSGIHFMVISAGGKQIVKKFIHRNENDRIVFEKM